MLSVFYASIIIVFSITIYKGLIGQQYGALVDFIFILPPIIHLKINELSYLKSKVVTIFSIVFLAIGSFSFLISDSRRILISISIVWLSTLVGKQKIVSIFAILVTFFIFSKFVDGLDYDFRYENSFSQFSNLLAGSAQEEEVDKFTTGRSQLWGAGINLILNNPIFGVGLSNHVVLLPTYGGYTEIRIHNIFLDLTAQTGILGLIVFLMLIYNLIQHLLKYKKNFKDLGLEINTKFVNSLLISLITVLIFAIFGGSFILERWGWFQIGFILSSLHAFNLKIK
jgi:O-antigen ligase